MLFDIGRRWFVCSIFACYACHLLGQEKHVPPAVELLPLPGDQVAFRVLGVEKTRWHFGKEYPRPFFYPLNGPSGTSLTRMGHPGAENHDHHRSVWFANNDVDGFTFWADGQETQIVQKHWYAYQDGSDEAVMGVALGWLDPDGVERMQQDLVAALRPGQEGEYELELQAEFRPGKGRSKVQLGKTNFGFLAVRVAKSLSEHFGGGRLVNSEGDVGEKEIFGKRARWMDYSGPVVSGAGRNRIVSVEGITYFDHPENPRHPSYWHVRSDGWMGASFGMHEGYEIVDGQPLRLRYSLHVHSGPYQVQRAARVFQEFAARRGFEIQKSRRPHRQYEITRETGKQD